MHYGWDPFAVEEQKIHKMNKNVMSHYWHSKKSKHFQQNIHSSYFLWRESKETTKIQRTDEGNLQGTMPEQCLITLNFIYVKKMAHNRVHNIGIHVIVVKITSAI